MAITQTQILNAIEAALDALVERYNEANDRDVAFGRDGDNVFTIDGGDQDGAFEVTVEVEDL